MNKQQTATVQQSYRIITRKIKIGDKRKFVLYSEHIKALSEQQKQHEAEIKRLKEHICVINEFKELDIKRALVVQREKFREWLEVLKDKVRKEACNPYSKGVSIHSGIILSWLKEFDEAFPK